MTHSYAEYRSLIDSLLLQGKTTGTNHSQAYLDYTRMNVQRMKRHDKTDRLSEALTAAVRAIREPQYWVLLTEAWCGDAAQTVPFIAKVAAESPFIHLELILRDEHLDVMDRFLTDGVSRSIPIVVMYRTDGVDGGGGGAEAEGRRVDGGPESEGRRAQGSHRDHDLDMYLQREPFAKWGPRPASLQTLYRTWKEDKSLDFPVIAERIHKWYAEDRNREIDAEFTRILSP